MSQAIALVSREVFMVLDLIWAAGQVCSFAILIGGAWLSLMETEPIATILHSARKVTAARFHEPLNHRLVDEDRCMVEW